MEPNRHNLTKLRQGRNLNDVSIHISLLTDLVWS